MNKCDKCNSTLQNEYSYCPYCGTPLSDQAKLLEKSKLKNIRLETLLQLLTLIEDEESLKRINSLIKTVK